MNVKKQLAQLIFPASMLFVFISQANANQVTGSLSATSMFSDNTRKTAQEPMDERQDLYQFGLNADYSNWLIEADAKYQLVYQEYAERSQSNEQYADGSSNILFGKNEDPLALELSHSRRMLLATPDAVGLTENQQEREIISARPEIRKRIFAADRVSLAGQFVRVSFPDDGLQNSKRDGFSLAWLHPLSGTSALQFSAQQQDVTFDHYSEADYSYAGATFAYDVALRKLKYRVEFGYNESEPVVGETQSAPSYQFSAVYLDGFNQIDLSASRLLTDSSFGNGNMENTSAVPGGDGLSMELDRVDRITADLTWQTSAICLRCSFSSGISAVEDSYLEKDEKSLSTYAHARFSYGLSRAANLSLSMTRADVDFESEVIAQDYKLDYLSLEYAYYFSNGINVRLAGRREDRESMNETLSGSYKENVYSVGLTYGF